MRLHSTSGAEGAAGAFVPPSLASAASPELERRARRLHALVKRRDACFMRPVLADHAMAVMLSLFIADLRDEPMTGRALALANLLEASQLSPLLEQLVEAGLVIISGEGDERRRIALSSAGSARMRSFISDFPDI